MIAKVEIAKYGSNKLRKHLNHIRFADLSKNRLIEPVIKGKGYKARDDTSRTQKDLNAQAKASDRVKVQRKSVELDLEANY